MNVSLIRLLQAGRFGELSAGMSKQEVQEKLGPPDYTGGESRKRRTPMIFVYGYLEVYFDYEDRDKLSWIFVDGMKEGSFGFGSQVTFEDWELSFGDSSVVVREFLERHTIPFQESTEFGYRIYTANRAVEISFSEEHGLETVSCRLDGTY